MFLYSSLSREVKMQEEKDLLSWTLYTEIITIICACMQLSAAGLALSSSTASPPSCQVTSFLPAQPGLLRWRLSHLVHLAAFYSGAGRRLKWITTIPFLCAESFSEEVIPLRGNPCGSFLQRSSTGLWGAAYGLCWCCPPVLLSWPQKPCLHAACPLQQQCSSRLCTTRCQQGLWNGSSVPEEGLHPSLLERHSQLPSPSSCHNCPCLASSSKTSKMKTCSCPPLLLYSQAMPPHNRTTNIQ